MPRRAVTSERDEGAQLLGLVLLDLLARPTQMLEVLAEHLAVARGVPGAQLLVVSHRVGLAVRPDAFPSAAHVRVGIVDQLDRHVEVHRRPGQRVVARPLGQGAAVRIAGLREPHPRAVHLVRELRRRVLAEERREIDAVEHRGMSRA